MRKLITVLLLCFSCFVCNAQYIRAVAHSNVVDIVFHIPEDQMKYSVFLITGDPEVDLINRTPEQNFIHYLNYSLTVRNGKADYIKAFDGGRYVKASGDIIIWRFPISIAKMYYFHCWRSWEEGEKRNAIVNKVEMR